MKKTAIIVTYFGKFPYYHELWEKSANFNSGIDWLVFTDQRKDEQNKNIKYINFNLDKINNLIKTKLSTEVSIKSPYKLCDLRPAYPVIFDNYLSNYEFWGHCDLDMIWGNIKLFLNYNYIWKNDIISADHRRICGPFTLYKNNSKIKNLHKDIKNYFKILNSEQPGIIDELEFNEVNEKGRCNQTLDGSKYSVFRGVHEILDAKIHIQRYGKDRAPCFWENGKLIIKSLLEPLAKSNHMFYGFGAQSMFVHVRKWHYIDLETNYMYHKNHNKEILEKWQKLK